MAESKAQEKKARAGAGSFCIPKAAIEALIDAQATAYEICAYLTLARFAVQAADKEPHRYGSERGVAGRSRLKYRGWALFFIANICGADGFA